MPDAIRPFTSMPLGDFRLDCFWAQLVVVSWEDRPASFGAAAHLLVGTVVKPAYDAPENETFLSAVMYDISPPDDVAVSSAADDRISLTRTRVAQSPDHDSLEAIVPPERIDHISDWVADTLHEEVPEVEPVDESLGLIILLQTMQAVSRPPRRQPTCLKR